MVIHGLNKTTLLDYPGHIAATVFLGGCNFRCPFCHNKDLVQNPQNQPVLSEEEVLSFLAKRKNILKGICISGGEPTLQNELPEFMRKLKSLGYLLKLDTNGSDPDMLKYLHVRSLVDYVAMDIKTCPEDYSNATGISANLIPFSQISDSVNFLMASCVEYEFRTTVARELHNADTFLGIADWIADCKAYFLQPYKDCENVIQRSFSSYSKEELNAFISILAPRIPTVSLRGVD